MEVVYPPLNHLVVCEMTEMLHCSIFSSETIMEMIIIRLMQTALAHEEG